MDAMKKQNYDLSDFITLEEGETVLWWGKPDGNVYFKEEKKFILYILFGIIFDFIVIGMFSIFAGSPFFFITVLLPLGIRLKAYFDWTNRKKNTLFTITEKQCINAFRFNNDIVILKKEIDTIRKYQTVKSKNGGTIYYSKYRFNFTKPYNIDTATFEFEGYSYPYFNKILSGKDYACFYDLSENDLETVQTLIGKLRERAKKERQTI